MSGSMWTAVSDLDYYGDDGRDDYEDEQEEAGMNETREFLECVIEESE